MPIMFQRIIAAFLLFALMLTNFSRLFIYAAFDFNQNYIVSTLCENRGSPEMNCNGQCYLAKKIKQAEEKEKKQQKDDQKNSFQTQWVVKSIDPLAIPDPTLKKSSFIEVCFDLPEVSYEIPHPPPSSFSTLS